MDALNSSRESPSGSARCAHVMYLDSLGTSLVMPCAGARSFARVSIVRPPAMRERSIGRGPWCSSLAAASVPSGAAAFGRPSIPSVSLLLQRTPALARRSGSPVQKRAARRPRDGADRRLREVNPTLVAWLRRRCAFGCSRLTLGGSSGEGPWTIWCLVPSSRRRGRGRRRRHGVCLANRWTAPLDADRDSAPASSREERASSDSADEREHEPANSARCEGVEELH